MLAGTSRTGEFYDYTTAFYDYQVIIIANPLIVLGQPVVPVDTQLLLKGGEHDPELTRLSAR
ncbi:hypothetical protein [Mycobacterium uberis]|uniref:hypothetical protein n=1 Tax=Mycobacterium uberis TaxID=2162698 RepID=UPI001FB5068D|nr:hypothetical protein [Mycobacterium uberis]